jgi:hypothetical protein
VGGEKICTEVVFGYVPARQKIILDPDEFAQCSDDVNAETKLEGGVGQNGFGEGVLNITHAYPEEHIIHVEWVTTPRTDMHLAHFVEILPKFHLGGILVQSREVPSEEDLAVLDCRTAVLRPDGRVLVVTAVSGGEDTGRDIVLEQFLVDGVHDVRDHHAHKVLAPLESSKIIWEGVSDGWI